MNVEKVKKGVYRLEKKEYTFKVLKGNGLAIRMFAGYIYAENLVHFDEEMNYLVR